MYEAIKIESTIKPEKIESLNNGIWYYNFDITEKVVPMIDESGATKEETRYEFVQVRISGEPTVQKCQEAILKEYKNSEGSSLYYLLTVGQTSTDQIEDIIYNINVDFGQAEPLSALEQAKKAVIRKIDEYDTSLDVNSFYLNGVQAWLDKSTRVGLMNSLSIEKEAGKTESTLWFNSISIVINIDAAIQMLSSLEIYALACYNKTAEHKVAIEALTTVEEVKAYDYTAGYPEKLTFTI